VEFALGMDPTSPNGGNGRAGEPVVIRTANGRIALYFWVPAIAGAPQGHGQAEVTYRVQASSDLVNWTNLSTKAPNSAWSGVGAVSVGGELGGYLPITIEDTEEITAQPRRYLRLQSNWTP